MAPTARSRPVVTKAAPVQTGEVELDPRCDQRQNLVGTPNAAGFVTLTMTWGSIGLRAIELPKGYWKRPDLLTDDEWRQAGDLAWKRLRRCRVGSDTWRRHLAVMETAERLSSEESDPNGERPALRLVTS